MDCSGHFILRSTTDRKPGHRTCHQLLIAAIFLDRNGVLVEDVHLLTNPRGIRVLEDVPQAIGSLKGTGFKLIVVSNQTLMTCSLVTEQKVHAINAEVEHLVEHVDESHLDRFYFCLHCPNAMPLTYWTTCDLSRDLLPRLLEGNRLFGFSLSGYRYAMNSAD